MDSSLQVAGIEEWRDDDAGAYLGVHDVEDFAELRLVGDEATKAGAVEGFLKSDGARESHEKFDEIGGPRTPVAQEGVARGGVGGDAGGGDGWGAPSRKAGQGLDAG
eukprot:CAMPEP_0174911510 /NCGR_PEP_ID=MMETSP0167-20121228/76971_1 /TAXON_ID=38298 /ORGANISM="Rhodella maculata, Strain CCMP736" /LENGTH=106 /DNA_ID=CAMNT_0016156025 /DNA_START=9 /DNA_END=330 /DNA_ORIENTATION=+